ncbi:hypothetical protein BC835DRAFT_1391175, partial [Cytidiella melzeri]
YASVGYSIKVWVIVSKYGLSQRFPAGEGTPLDTKKISCANRRWASGNGVAAPSNVIGWVTDLRVIVVRFCGFATM